VTPSSGATVSQGTPTPSQATWEISARAVEAAGGEAGREVGRVGAESFADGQHQIRRPPSRRTEPGAAVFALVVDGADGLRPPPERLRPGWSVRRGSALPAGVREEAGVGRTATAGLLAVSGPAAGIRPPRDARARRSPERLTRDVRVLVQQLERPNGHEEPRREHAERLAVARPPVGLERLHGGHDAVVDGVPEDVPKGTGLVVSLSLALALGTDAES
jgi:hypothetical protein